MAFRRRAYNHRLKCNTYRSRNEERYRDHETEDNFSDRHRNRDDKKYRYEEKYRNPEPNYEKNKFTQVRRRNLEIEPKRVDHIAKQPENSDRVPIKNERISDVLVDHNHETNKIEVKRAENLAHLRNRERNHETEDNTSDRHRNRNDKKHRYEEKYHNPVSNHEKNKSIQAKKRSAEIEPKRVDPIANQPEKSDRALIKNERISDVLLNHNHETNKIELKRTENLANLRNCERNHEAEDNVSERHRKSGLSSAQLVVRDSFRKDSNRSDDKCRYGEKYHSPEPNREINKPIQAKRRNPEIKLQGVHPITIQPEKLDQLPIKNEKTTLNIPASHNHETNKVELKPVENSVHLESHERNHEIKDSFSEKNRNRSDDKYRYGEKCHSPEPNRETKKPIQAKRRNPKINPNRVDPIVQPEKPDQVPIENERTTVDVSVNHNQEISNKVEVKSAENSVHLENGEHNLDVKDNVSERNRKRSDDKFRCEEKHHSPEPNHKKNKPTRTKRRNLEVKPDRVDLITNQPKTPNQVPIQKERITSDVPVNHNYETNQVEVNPAENLVHLEKCDQQPYDTPRKLINGELIGFPFKYPLKLITPLRDTPDCLKEKLNALRNSDICPVVPMLNEHRMLDNHETANVNSSSSFSVLSVNDAEHGAFSRKGRKRPVVQTRVINVKKVCTSS